jgi:hypothetical protein
VVRGEGTLAGWIGVGGVPIFDEDTYTMVVYK